MTVPVLRKRACRPKVRTGCRTCRARHIKCGEERPTCRNCNVSGKECKGYDIVKPPARSRLPMLQPNDAHMVLLPSPTYPPPTLPSGVKSTAGFEYFICKAFQDLPGDGWALGWDRLVLPFCQSEPAILYAAMAIGSLRQQTSSHCGPNFESGQLNTALAHYGRSASIIRTAIAKHVQNASSTDDVETILTASLLLFCFEILHDQDELANMHLCNGLKILHEHISRGPPTKAILYSHHQRPVKLSVAARSRMDLLTQTFVRLDSELSPLCQGETFLSPICAQPVPNSFASLDEAMVYLDVIHSQVFNIGRKLDDLARIFLEATYPDFDTLDEFVQNMLIFARSRTVECSSELHLRIQGSRNALHVLMAALATLPRSRPPDLRRMLVEMQVFIVWFDASTWRDADEMEVDRFDEQFHHIMSIAERYYAANKTEPLHQSRPSTTTRPAFDIGSGVANTVCTIIEKSRNSTLRRRGIKLISEMDMRGTFDAAFLASYYQCVVDMEETEAKRLLGLPNNYVFHFNEIPAQARLMEVEIAPVDDGDELMYYHRQHGRAVYVNVVDGELRHGEQIFRVRRPFVAT